MSVCKNVLVVAVFAFWVGVAGPVAAQPALQRLEDRIRNRLDGPNQPDRPVIGEDQPPGQQAEGRQAAEPGYLGVVADDKKDRGRGIRILDLRPGGPAEKGGLRKQDLITAVAGIRVRQMSDMAEVLQLSGVGEAVIFEIVREGKARQVQVTLGPRPAVPLLPPEPAPPAAPLPPGPNVPMPADANPAADAAEVERLQQRVAQLERRVADLERVLADMLKKQ